MHCKKPSSIGTVRGRPSTTGSRPAARPVKDDCASSTCTASTVSTTASSATSAGPHCPRNEAPRRGGGRPTPSVTVRPIKDDCGSSTCTASTVSTTASSATSAGPHCPRNEAPRRGGGRPTPSVTVRPIKDDCASSTCTVGTVSTISSIASSNDAPPQARKEEPRRPCGGKVPPRRIGTVARDGPTSRVGRAHVRLCPRRLGMSFQDYYVITREIDSGSFSTVYEAFHRYNGTRFAVKIMDRRRLTPESDEAVFREAKILKHLNTARRRKQGGNSKHDATPIGNKKTSNEETDHGFVRLVDFYIEPTRFYLVMDYMTGGSVFDRVLDRQCYSEEDAKKFAANLFKSVSYMHGQNIVHRDLKPQNLLLASPDDNTDVRIADFGFATAIRPRLDENGTPNRKVLRQKCGTPSYVAPEVLSGHPYDESADMWSLGVIMYFVLGGYPPFVDYQSKRGLFKQIVNGDYTFHETDWKGVSNEAKHFISSLLTVNPHARISANEALSHPWLSGSSNPLAKRVVKKKDEGTSRVQDARRKVLGAFAATSKAENISPEEASVSPSIQLEYEKDIIANGGRHTKH